VSFAAEGQQFVASLGSVETDRSEMQSLALYATEVLGVSLSDTIPCGRNANCYIRPTHFSRRFY